MRTCSLRRIYRNEEACEGEEVIGGSGEQHEELYEEEKEELGEKDEEEKENYDKEGREKRRRRSNRTEKGRGSIKKRVRTKSIRSRKQPCQLLFVKLARLTKKIT